MPILLLFLGAVLMGLTWRQAWRQAVEEEKDSRHMQVVLDLGERMTDLENRIAEIVASHREPAFSQQEAAIGGIDYKMELLLRAVAGLEDKVASMKKEKEEETEENTQIDFSTYIREATQESRFNEIYEAYLSGKTVTEIAQQFGKGKGEVELILNLRKSGNL